MYRNKRIVCLGGGTGLSTMLRGLKVHTDQLSAVVTVADNGGSSGMLRREMNILPPGDIRNCILALAETEPIMHSIFQYRFKEGSLGGQNLGNLFLAALTDICGSFEGAIEMTNEVLAVTGQVLPVTTQNVQLSAVYDDGSTIVGEHEIVYTNKVVRKKIDEVTLIPERPMANPNAVEAIKKADLVIIGPGSLFTSLIPNLLVEGISEAIRDSYATVAYVGNIMTQPGETDGFTLCDHVKEIERYLGKNVLQYVIANDANLDRETKEHYNDDDAHLVINDLGDCEHFNVVETDMITLSAKEGYVRHDAKKLADILIGL